MRVLLVLLGVVALASAVPFTSSQYELLFTKYIQQYGKQYSSLAEFEQRYNIFRDNLNLVHKHNQEYEQGLHSFTLGMNKFADMTNEEYRKTVLGFRRHNTTTRGLGLFRHPIPHPIDKVEALPTSVDWRTKGVVTGVKDQGQCGSCWSFSAVGSMEGAHALATGKLASLSEQELVDCANGGQDTCDVGGQMTDGFTYAIQNGGMETEADYPYTATSGNTCAFDKSKSVATFSGYRNVTSGSEASLQSAAASQPTVSVAIDASSIWFQLYSSGVYDDSSCKNGIDDLDHGVLVVGYDQTSAGQAYWIVKNSWGGIWGQQGYIWMTRNKNNQCGIATDASYPLV
jgi:cathepsin L